MRRILVFALCCFLVIPFHAFAAESAAEVAMPKVLFSEVMANPLDESTGEYIELLNDSENPIDVSGWTLNDLVDTKDTLKDYTESFDIGASGTTIPPHSLALVVDADYAGEYNTIIEAHADLTKFLMLTVDDASLGNGLGNTSDTLTLKNLDGSYTVSHAWASDTGNGVSWSGYALGKDTETWKKSLQAEGGTPGFLNNAAPQAVLAAPSIEGEVPFIVTLDTSDSSDPEGLPLHLSVDFGDGETLSQDTALFQHTYTEVGDYNAQLTVSDSEGATSETYETIHVVPKHVVPACNLVISEILPNPSGDDGSSEFIEIQNTAETTCHLLGYKVDDADGGSSPYTFGEENLSAHAYLAVFSNVSHITLNNTADSARILTPENTSLYRVSYTSAKEAQSYALNGSAFTWTTSVTPNAQNVITTKDESGNEDPTDPTPTNEDPEDPLELSNIRDAKHLQKDDDVLVEGFVIAKVGTLSSQYLYIHDGTSGIQIYSSKKLLPKVSLGKKIRVKGTISKTASLTRILIHEEGDITVLSDSKNVPSLFKKTGKIAISDEGELVAVTGTIEKKTGTSAIINDGSGSLVVSFRDGTGLKASSVTTGKRATIQGIITVSNDQVEILPRSSMDIKTAATLQTKYHGSLPQAGANTLYFVVSSGMVGILFFAVFQLFCARRSKTRDSALSKNSGKNFGTTRS